MGREEQYPEVKPLAAMRDLPHTRTIEFRGETDSQLLRMLADFLDGTGLVILSVNFELLPEKEAEMCHMTVTFDGLGEQRENGR